jgi:hypothetical protein
MTIHDEHDFRAQLGTALDEFAPGPVPFHAVVRQGKAVMIRKRITAVAVGLAVLAAAALVPTLLHALHRTAPVTHHYHVTVKPRRQAPRKAWSHPGSSIGLAGSSLPAITNVNTGCAWSPASGPAPAEAGGHSAVGGQVPPLPRRGQMVPKQHGCKTATGSGRIWCRATSAMTSTTCGSI